MFVQQKLKALPVTMLRAEMAGGVAFDIGCVEVRLSLEQHLDYGCVAADARDVQGRSLVVCPRIHLGAKGNERLDQADVTFICSHMHGSPTIAVALVQ